MNRQEILEKVAAGELSIDEAGKLMEQDERKPAGLYCKVSPKGGVSVYGLQRMPVTLYASQWERLLDFAEEIRKFVEGNNDKLKRKD